MRVISGTLKGREIKGYTIEGTRPTMDRVKESMFAIIQNNIKGSVCLDLFSGSGNLGIEAISNGAKKCYFVDHNKIAIKIIKNNINNLGVDDKSIVIHDDYKKALENFKKEKMKFNIVFLDPPYADEVINDILNYLYKNNLLKRDAIVVCEYKIDTIKNEYYEIEKEKKYGYKKVVIYTEKD
jgi:16S rRNA (guanine(966)-N(2))-methyltransferase RsmD